MEKPTNSEKAAASHWQTKQLVHNYSTPIFSRRTIMLLRVFAFAILCSILLFFSSFAHAQTIGLHIASAHFPDNGYNNFNPGLYYRAESGVTLGAYHNSERKPSFYLGYTLNNETYPVSLTVGAITGYHRAKILPLIVPSIHTGKILPFGTLRLSLIPKVGYNPAVVHLSVERGF